MVHKFADSRLKPIQEYRDYLKVQKRKVQREVASRGEVVSISIMMLKNY